MILQLWPSLKVDLTFNTMLLMFTYMIIGFCPTFEDRPAKNAPISLLPGLNVIARHHIVIFKEIPI